MRIHHFEDTDTLYVIFKKAEIEETKDLNENTLVEIDAQGNLVSMAIEHARERTDVAGFSFSRVPSLKPMG